MNKTPRDIVATSSRNRREVFLLDAQHSQERIKIQTRIRPVTKSNDLSAAVSQKMIADSQQAATNISQDKPLSHAARHLRSIEGKNDYLQSIDIAKKTSVKQDQLSTSHVKKNSHTLT